MFSFFDRITGFSGLTGFFNKAIKAAYLNHIRALSSYKLSHQVTLYELLCPIWFYRKALIFSCKSCESCYPV